ncbi:DUF1501 domain-containing protein [Caulobacter sp. S45]|uniref:DUF1501 domain-containing protein n=1 Tax=Caulobacter sp. S45 TaxID=1641861 RepID=UPI0015760204|nr:DUF1501 domain-containing protein [Caulobacter sp. S45]
MTHLHPSRRGLLSLGASLGMTFLAAPVLADPLSARRKLVVIVCRGAMDGLSVSPPLGDRDYAALRGPIAIAPDKVLKLDADFGLHPKLATVHALAQSGQARIAPAVAIPERIRSHFEAQDLLESGGARVYDVTTGWLNRALAASSRDGRVTAISVGPEEPLILRGPSPVQSWSPGGRQSADLGRITTTLQDLYKHDPILGPALASGLQTEATADTLNGGQTIVAKDARALAVTAGRFVASDGGPSIAVLQLDGFDTHASQGAAEGQLANRLKALDDVVAGLKEGLGPAWGQTVVVTATEFGRTAHVNGTGGTDHGTASTLILAGGALKPGGIVGDWPTLEQSKLFEARDLAPTLDVRQVFKGLLQDHMGVDRAALDSRIFPDSGAAAPVANLV